MTQRTKTAVNMTLDADLVSEASALTPDLSKTVEELLTAYIKEKQTEQIDTDRGVDSLIEWHNEFVARYGLPGEDFMPL